MAGKPTITVVGLKEARRDLRRVDAALARQMTPALKAGAAIVTDEARRRAPRRSGRLAASIRPGASGTRAVVRSRLPYAAAIHWGWRKHHIRANPFIERAATAKADQALEKIADGIDDMFRRNGFR